MKPQLTKSPYPTIYNRFVDAVVAHARRHTEKRPEQVLRDVAENDRLFKAYYTTFKKHEIDDLVIMIKLRRSKMR